MNVKVTEIREEGTKIVATVDLRAVELDDRVAEAGQPSIADHLADDQHAHLIDIPVEAVGDRQFGYQLAEPFDALEAIIREHGLRLSRLDPQGDDLPSVLGGVDDRIGVSWAGQAKKDAARILDAHAHVVAEVRDRPTHEIGEIGAERNEEVARAAELAEQVQAAKKPLPPAGTPDEA